MWALGPDAGAAPLADAGPDLGPNLDPDAGTPPGTRSPLRIVCHASFPLLRSSALRYAPFSRTVKGEEA